MKFKSIIQDCEDALTNWVESSAAVSSKLSTRARTLSQRRTNKSQGMDLSGQDQSMRESGLWVPASAHAGNYEGEEEDGEEEGGHEETGHEEEAEAKTA